MLYTIAQASEQLGITKQAVYKKIKRVEKNIKRHMCKKNGVTYITEHGLELLKTDLNEFQPLEEDLNENKQVESNEKENTSKSQNTDYKEQVETQFKDGINQLYVDELKDKIEILKSQLEKEEKEKDELRKDIEFWKVAFAQEKQEKQMLLGMGKRTEEAAATKEENKKGFFARLFGK